MVTLWGGAPDRLPCVPRSHTLGTVVGSRCRWFEIDARVYFYPHRVETCKR